MYKLKKYNFNYWKNIFYAIIRIFSIIQYKLNNLHIVLQKDWYFSWYIKRYWQVILLEKLIRVKVSWYYILSRRKNEIRWYTKSRNEKFNVFGWERSLNNIWIPTKLFNLECKRNFHKSTYEFNFKAQLSVDVWQQNIRKVSLF